MTRDEVVALMTETFNESNKGMALQAGMSEEEVAKLIDQSTPSINFSLGLVYDALIQKDIIKQ